MRKIGLIAILLLLGCSAGDANGNGEYVVLLHGLARGTSSMEKMERYLAGMGFTVINEGYPSTDYKIESLAEKNLAAIIARKCPDSNRKINFVTHSMGGIVLRYYLKNHPLANLGRTVMLSPPNRGSSAADFYRDVSLVKYILGPALGQIGTGKDSLIRTLGPLNFEAGIITGSSTIDPFTSALIPGEDDGRVAIEEAKAENMKDFMVVKRSHAFIMDSPEVLNQTGAFLTKGAFYKNGSLPGDR
jgi:triacylglycerol lipase